MSRFTLTIRFGILVAFMALAAGSATASDFDSDLQALQHAWAKAQYEAEGDAQEDAFEALEKQAALLVETYPDRPEGWIWEGIVLSSYAGAKGGLGALGLAKHSRKDLEKALAMDEKALDGSAHTSLGVLYYKVPGWPFGFGDDDKAREHLERALEINPDGIDPNYFLGEYLFEEDQYIEARHRLEMALAAPDRPDRPLADAGRRQEARALLERVREELED